MWYPIQPAILAVSRLARFLVEDDVVCVGYSSTQFDSSNPPLPQLVAAVNSRNWYFSPGDFSKSRAEVETRTRWCISGETDSLLVAAQPKFFSESVLK
jgi:hypothetical protein